jgi:hypothetical protein
MRVPLAYLREIGAVPAPAAGSGPVEELLADFRVYLARERGLVAGTVATTSVPPGSFWRIASSASAGASWGGSWPRM